LTVTARLLLLRRNSPLPQLLSSALLLVLATTTTAQQHNATHPGPTLPFTDVTNAAGVTFVPLTGAVGDKLLPETMGGGVAFLDYDNDGDQDLLFVGGTLWPSDAPKSQQPSSLALYGNDGTGHFIDETVAAGLETELYGMGAAVGDIDGDGDSDLYITALGPNQLYRNGGGYFTNITDGAGVAGDDSHWSTAAGFSDLDGDGDLDLLVGNYVNWSREIDLDGDRKLTGIPGRAYAPPMAFEGQGPQLYRNRGDGVFDEVSAESGLHITGSDGSQFAHKTLAWLFLDIDDDGDTDVFAANDTTRNLLFINDGKGHFDEQGQSMGVAYDAFGSPTGAMGVDAGFFSAGDEFGLFVGNFADEASSAYVGVPGDGFLFDDSVVLGLAASSRPALTFGLLLFDVDLDGQLDLLQVNGHLEPTIDSAPGQQTWRQAPQLYWNAGPGTRPPFRLSSAAQVGDLATPIVGRGAATADIDGDGDLDLALTRVGERPLVLRNDQSSGHHWLRCVLAGRPGNPTALGAVVTVKVGDKTMRQHISPTRSYLSQSETVATFGLGKETQVDSLAVRWPDGSEQEYEVAGLDRTVKLVQAIDEREVLATFIRGTAQLATGRVSDALQTLNTAAELAPSSAPNRRNLGRALLAAGDAEAALQHLAVAAELDADSLATVYLQAICYSRLGQLEQALPLFEQAVTGDPHTAALRFQLASCAASLGSSELAAEQLRETVRLNRAHSAAWYRIAANARRARDTDGFRAANREFSRLRAMYGDAYKTPVSLEACRYTAAESAGAAADTGSRSAPAQQFEVSFTDATSEVLGDDTDGALLAAFALTPSGQIELLRARTDGVLERLTIPAAGAAEVRRLSLTLPGVDQASGIAVGNVCDSTPDSLQAGVLPTRLSDVFIAGPEQCWLLTQDEQGELHDITDQADLGDLSATAALFVDHEHDGDLDLAIVGSEGLQLFVNASDGSFFPSAEVPEISTPAVQLVALDFNDNGAVDLAVATGTGPTLRIDNQRAGQFALLADPPGSWPQAQLILADDLDNDGAPDAVLISSHSVQLVFAGVPLAAQALGDFRPTAAALIDMDADGWLDLALSGTHAENPSQGRLILLRNNGRDPWVDVTAACGLTTVSAPPSDAMIAADVDGDGDCDLMLRSGDDKLTVLRNESNAGTLLKLRLISLVGSSGAVGTRIEVRDGTFFASRTVQQEQPIEIGLGELRHLDSVLVVWPNGVVDARTDVTVTDEPLSMVVIEKPDTGSCPFLYFWDGEQRRFIGDMIGGGATDLPLSRTQTNPVNPREIIVVGDSETFVPEGSAWDVRVTNELREATYYDAAALLIVDHPVGTEVASSDRLRGPPFPQSTVMALGQRRELLSATGDDGLDRTAAFREIDGVHGAPGAVHPAPLRGVCEPMALTLDFGPLPNDRPLALALTGWINYGTASSNIAISQRDDIPVIVPVLQARDEQGRWHDIDVVVGLPAGKAKTIVCELDGLLPPGTNALRLNTTFELRWDRAALFERIQLPSSAVHQVLPDVAQLRWRGFSELIVRAPTQPKLPDYALVSQQPQWRGALEGWCTRYGDVLELITAEDGRLVVLNSGDELRLSIPAADLPPRPAGTTRTLLWRSVGYNKEADPNNAGGGHVWPLSVDTRKGRSDEDEDAWRTEYNTRWVPYDLFHSRRAGTR
jgi:tetratricopeptide (TPR) repeat protein